MEFEWKWGPSAIIGGVQIIVIVIGGIFAIAQVGYAVENSKLAVAELRNVVAEQQRMNISNADRITRVEVTLVGVEKSIDRVEKKLDQPKIP